ncbi:MAG: hypothetical protein NZ923_03255 [Candidatus Kryptonium sp.]|nr:hypothetical protein [Candidatus Kryptonium sp.]
MKKLKPKFFPVVSLFKCEYSEEKLNCQVVSSFKRKLKILQ